MVPMVRILIKSMRRGDRSVTANALRIVVMDTITAVEATICACSTGPRFLRNVLKTTSGFVIVAQCTKHGPDFQRGVKVAAGAGTGRKKDGPAMGGTV
jgi:hypothetical protein